MKNILFYIILLMPFCTIGQGVKFENARSWKEVKALAGQQNKYLFVDAFTTWCGPCKYMSNTVFPQEKVGNFFNENFINLQVQLDTTAKDDEMVKLWYKDAHFIMNEYNVRAFPTFLFFDPNGNLVHKIVGASDGEAFIKKAANALNKEHQYYTLLNAYQSNPNQSEALLLNLSKSAMEAYEMEKAREVFSKYLSVAAKPINKESFSLFSSLVSGTDDIIFKTVYSKKKEFNTAAENAGAANSFIVNAMINEAFKNADSKIKNLKIDELKKEWQKKYPAYADEASGKLTYVYHRMLRNWEAFGPAIYDYMEKFGKDMSPSEINEIAWTVFEKVNDPKILNAAVQWSKWSIEKEENPMYIDTYANLLYKTGKKKEAVSWQTRAVNMVPEKEKADYQETLDKMNADKKTW